MLRNRIDATRIVPTPQEKNLLLRAGESIGHDINELLHIVQPKTYRRWLREQKKSTRFRTSGRPRIPEVLRALIIRMRKTNTRGATATS
jgi:hypothetical protein